jgi:hypothetical protein
VGQAEAVPRGAFHPLGYQQLLEKAAHLIAGEKTRSSRQVSLPELIEDRQSTVAAIRHIE